MAPGSVFTKLDFLRNLRMSTISYIVRLQCARKACQFKNALAYWHHSKVTMKIKCCEYNPTYSQHFIFLITYESVE